MSSILESDRVAAAQASAVPDVAQPTRRRLVLLLPAGLFAGVATALGVALNRDPEALPSALIGKPVPEFSLPPVQGRTLGLSSADLNGNVSLVNVFASWCTACRAEHPLFMPLRERGTVPVHGLNYKDRPQDAASWFDALGDPYTRRSRPQWAGVDRLGSYGVPETFVVSRSGIILHKHIGPATEQALNETVLPLVARSGS